MTPAIPELRQYLTSAYSDAELGILCADYFRDVYENCADSMIKTAKIQLLLDHCQRRDLLPNLAAVLERDRAEQYRRRFAPPVVAPRVVAPPPGRDPRQIFVSHAHEDADFAHRLAADLRAVGWRVWIAPESIRPGEKWAEAISRGLEECGIFVVALTPAAVASDWVKTETNLAIELAQRREARFIPLSVVDCRLPMLWTAFQWIPFAGRYPAGLAALLTTLDGGQAKSSLSPITAPIGYCPPARP